MAGRSETPFSQTRKRIDAKIQVRLVAQLPQRRLQTQPGDIGPRKIQRQVKRLLVEPVAQARLEDLQHAGLKQSLRVRIANFGFSGGWIYKSFFAKINET